MRGITEDELKNLAGFNFEPDESINTFITGLLKIYCKELNPWQPIETAPKDKKIILYDASYGVVTGGCSSYAKLWTTDITSYPLKPTHWMELPEPPK